MSTPGDICTGALQVCSPGEVMLVTWTADVGANNWRRGGQGCVVTSEVAAGDDLVIPAVTLDDVRRLGLPPATANVEPAGGDVALNIPTNVYAAATPITRHTTIVGFDVTIEATPLTYTWTFGDGSTLGPTTDAGGAYPRMTTTHTYTQPGTYAINLTTDYSARYDIAGLGFQDIAGTVAVTTPPITLTAHEGTNLLTH